MSGKQKLNQLKIIKKAEKDGKTIEQTKELLKQHTREEEFVLDGRTSAERSYRREEVRKQRDARMNDVAGPQLSLEKIKDNYERNTDDGKKIVAKEEKKKISNSYGRFSFFLRKITH